MEKTFTSLHPKEEVSDEEKLMAAVQSPQGLKTEVRGVEVMEHTPAVAELFT